MFFNRKGRKGGAKGAKEKEAWGKTSEVFKTSEV